MDSLFKRIERIYARVIDVETPYGRRLHFESVREGGIHWMSLLIGEKVNLQWGTLTTSQVDQRVMTQILAKEVVDSYLLSLGV